MSEAGFGTSDQESDQPQNQRDDQDDPQYVDREAEPAEEGENQQ